MQTSTCKQTKLMTLNASHKSYHHKINSNKIMTYQYEMPTYSKNPENLDDLGYGDNTIDVTQK